jgi:glucuronate isomerase
MKSFLCEDFLLSNDTARRLYHDHAANQPIFDYHCHLNPRQVREDHQFANMSEIWLAGDHYKWRAMRSAGIDEHLITGNASDRDKFEAWAKTVPLTMGNPLFHWTHLELRRPFGITDKILSPTTANEIWHQS